MKIQTIVAIPIVVMAIVIFVVNLPDLFGPPLLSWPEKTNVMLTTALVIFAGIEVYSANVKLKIEKKKNAIEMASDELEKAYGPIYSILNKPDMVDNKTYNLPVYEKATLDEKLATYRSMFPPKIVTFWEENIRYLDSVLTLDPNAGTRHLVQTGDLPVVAVDQYKIPIEFVKMFTDEYMKRSEKLRELLAE